MCSLNMSSSFMEEEPKKHASSRRSNKPLMEKRRRERINRCLSQLKLLVLQALKKDSTHYSKLEKADILEMTVKHLKAIQRQQLMASAAVDPHVMSKYIAGYNECAMEVSRYMESVQSVNADVKTRVLDHLAGCITQGFPTKPENSKRPDMPVLSNQMTPRVGVVLPQQLHGNVPQNAYSQHVANSRSISQCVPNMHIPLNTQGQITVVTQNTYSVPPSPSTSPSSCSDSSYEYEDELKHSFGETPLNYSLDSHTKRERQSHLPSNGVQRTSNIDHYTKIRLAKTESMQPKSGTDSSSDSMWRPW